MVGKGSRSIQTMRQQSSGNLKYWVLIIAVLIGTFVGLSYLFENGHSKNYYVSGKILERDKNLITIQINPEDSEVRVPIDQNLFSFNLSDITGWKDPVQCGDYIRLTCSSDMTYLFGVYNQSPTINLTQ